MAQIKVTGHAAIDNETAQIALMVRAWRPGSNDEYCYREAERLRDVIMAGTRELDSRQAAEGQAPDRKRDPLKVTDVDGDEWTRRPDGSYTCGSLALDKESLSELDRCYGPLCVPLEVL